MTASASGEVRRWPLPKPASNNPEYLVSWVEAAGGIRLAGPDTELLDIDDWKVRGEELRHRWPEAALELARRRALTPENDADWHDTRTRDAETVGNTHAILWHLERLERLRPNDWTVPARRGAALAHEGEYAAAAAAYTAAIQRGGGVALRDHYAHQAAIARNLGRERLARWYSER